ncbi:hypothetical protein C8R31_101204 [Nitrosospira sp. Nsp2]|nr:hypothetical protein C8R31_101204 [Nitrosospira sp. Nsp2]
MMRMNNPRLLLVEDDDHKLQAVQGLVRDQFRDANITVSRSLSSAVNTLSIRNFDFALIDMSLPTYDFIVDKAGGGAATKLRGYRNITVYRGSYPGNKSLSTNTAQRVY